MLRELVSNNDERLLEEDGVEIRVGDVQTLMREFYHELRNYFALRGHVIMNQSFSLGYGTYEAGSYFPSVEPDDRLMVEELNVNLNNVERVKVFYSSGDWIDIHFKYSDHSYVTMCFVPVDREGIDRYFEKSIINEE